MSPRHYSAADRLLINFDQALRTLFATPTPRRPSPADAFEDEELTEQERTLAQRLMRVNHSGEVSAQALYLGQALTARTAQVRERMERSSEEENDHLAWCEQRVEELGSHTSYLNPAWYVGSLTIGVLAGLAGDRWSLGFIAETEHQVVKHLEGHLWRLPDRDRKSRAILEQMKVDEAHHATTALQSGGTALPGVVKGLMGVASRVMTRTAYWI